MACKMLQFSTGQKGTLYTCSQTALQPSPPREATWLDMVLKQEAWPTYWFHYLDSSPLFEPASALAKQFNNTCQLLKCQGFLLRVNSLTGVTRTTYQLLLTSWQWGGCYRFSRDDFNHRKGWPGDRKIASLPTKEVTLIPALAKIKKHVAFWLLHWPFLLVASFWHITRFYDKRLYIS